MRAATEAEILATARVLLVDGGISAVTLREVGRRIGVTASALYRYFDGRAALLDALIAFLFDELSDTVQASGPYEKPEDMTQADGMVHDLLMASHAFRRWSLAHPAEFGLMFGPRDPDWSSDKCVREAVAGDRFGQVFAGMFAAGFDVSKGDREHLFGALPHPLNELFARSWSRLLGTVSVEVFGHHLYMSVDADRMFDMEMKDCGDLIAQEMHRMSRPNAVGGD